MDDNRYIRKLTKNVSVRIIGKERLYVEDPSQVPEGAQLEEGPKGGLYYETEQVEEFQAEMEEYKEKVFSEYNWSDEQISQMGSVISQYEENAEQDFSRIVNAAAGGADISGGSYRIKGTGSALEKVYERDNKYEDPEDLTDVFGSRVLCKDARDTKATADAIVNEFGKDAIVEYKDYVEEPKSGYYRAVHLLVDMGDGRTGEIQVKSPEMAEIAHVGHTAVYKNKLNLDDSVRDEVSDCLTQLMDSLFGESQNGVDCSQEANQIISEVAETAIA